MFASMYHKIDPVCSLQNIPLDVVYEDDNVLVVNKVGLQELVLASIACKHAHCSSFHGQLCALVGRLLYISLDAKQ